MHTSKLCLNSTAASNSMAASQRACTDYTEAETEKATPDHYAKSNRHQMQENMTAVGKHCGYVVRAAADLLLNRLISRHPSRQEPANGCCGLRLWLALNKWNGMVMRAPSMFTKGTESPGRNACAKSPLHVCRQAPDEGVVSVRRSVADLVGQV